jgi:membrane fusion protein (multidrug efflux system)
MGCRKEQFTMHSCSVRVVPIGHAIVSTIFYGLLLAGCAPKADKKDKQPPQVGFVVVQPTRVEMTTELTGRVAAAQSSDVRPQVSGVIKQRFFTEGGIVHRGQTLYEIDPRVYQAAVSEAQANLRSAQANATAARLLADRYRPLAKAEAIAQQDYTNAQSQADQAQAAIEQSAARLRTAQVNLLFTRVPAPITGRIGRSLFTEGALVTSGQADPLATIQRMDPVYVDLQESTADLLALRRALARPGMIAGSAAIRLVLEDGTSYDRVGQVQFSEVLVSQVTGTVTLRATFPNPGGILLPGMFVRAVFVNAVSTSAFRVPQQAVRRDAKGNATVFVVGKDEKAVLRPIVTKDVQGDAWVVTDGLKPGDKVIAQGLDNVKPDKKVKPVAAGTVEQVGPSETGKGSAKAEQD